jgi:Brp/Blh family beta-carotene 15,15'-monooxygenase
MGVVAMGADVTLRSMDRAMAVGWVGLALASLPTLLGVALSPVVEYLPLLVSLVVLGLPHGATDDLVTAWSLRVSRRRGLALAAGLYALAGGVYLLAWFYAPLASFAFFIVLTWAHWGLGDLAAVLAGTGYRYPRSRVHRVLNASLRGALPMLVPLVAFPVTYQSIVTVVVDLFGATPEATDWVFTPGTRAVVTGGLVALTVVTLAWGAVTDRDGFRVDLFETGLLWAFFSVVPPVFAVGVYFTLWHSLRHATRVLCLDPVGLAALAADRPLAAAGRFVRDAGPNTLVALCILLGLALTVPRTPVGVSGLVAVYLVLLAVLTLPHAVVVGLLDWKQGVWDRSEEV